MIVVCCLVGYSAPLGSSAMSEYLSLIDRVETADAESSLGRLRTQKLHGIEVWPLVRVRLHDLPPAASQLSRGLSVGQVLLLIKGGMHLLWAMVYQTICGRSNQGGCVFFSHPENMSKLNGQWHDRSCDPIGAEAERLNLSVSVMEYSTNLKWRLPTARPRLDTTLVLVVAKLVSLVLVFWYRFFHSAELTKLEKYLKESGAHKCVSQSEVHGLAAFVVCARGLLTIAMRPWRFRLGFVCTFYSSSGMAFVLACKQLGITVYDIQHGVQGEGHIAYRNWVAKNGHIPKVLPDGFWCWDLASSAQLKRWCCRPTGRHVITGGDVWTEYVLGSPLAELNKSVESDLRRTVLVSLQPVPKPLPDILLQAMAAGPADLLWVLRLHPVMTEAFAADLIEQIDKIGCKNYRIQGNCDEPLPIQLLRTDLHVTLYSSVVIEAAALGVFSVLLDPRAVGVFRDTVDSGQAALVETGQELLAYVAASKRINLSKRPVRLIATSLREILEDISRQK